jgi:hypothetical protein
VAFTARLGTADSLLGSILLGEILAQFVTVTDAPTISENVTSVVSAVKTTTDSPTTSENVTRILSALRDTSDAPTISDVAEVVGVIGLTATDAPTISEDVDWVAILDRTTTDTATLSEDANASKTYVRTATDSPLLSEIVTIVHVKNVSATDAPTISESITSLKTLFRSLSQPLTITQSVTVVTPEQNIEQELTITQSVVSTGEYSKSASNDLTGLLQVADYFQFKPIDIDNTLTITHDVDVLKTTGVVSELTITQDVVYQYDPHYDEEFGVLVPTQTVTISAEFNRTLSQTLTIAQTAVSLKLIVKSVTSFLGLYQTALGGPLRNASNTLIPDQDVDVEVLRNKTLSQSLTITHSVGLQMILNRSLTSTLVFNNEHPIPDGAGGFIYVPNLIYTKGGSTLGNPNCICPVVSATTVLQSGTRTIILPNPEYNDAESLVAAVSIKRTITGDTYSYVKKSNNRKLKYKFLISQRKAYELRKFLLDYLGNRVAMTTCKGEMWTGFILTDPSEIISNSRGDACKGDLYEVNLEYQGVRVN